MTIIRLWKCQKPNFSIWWVLIVTLYLCDTIKTISTVRIFIRKTLSGVNSLLLFALAGKIVLRIRLRKIGREQNRLNAPRSFNKEGKEVIKL